MIIFPDDAKQFFMYQLFVGDGYTPETRQFQMHLYATPYLPTASTTLDDLTAIETTYPGYAPVALTSEFDNDINANDYDVYTWDAITFTASGSDNITLIAGYWVDALTSGDTREICWAESLPNPTDMSQTGYYMTITPLLGCGQG